MTPREAHEKICEIYNSLPWSERSKAENNPKVKNEIRELKKIIIKDAKLAAIYACRLSGKRWIEAEEFILKDSRALVEYVYGLAAKEDGFQERWLTAEPAILKGKPNVVFDYYSIMNRLDQFKDGWKEAETIFAKKMPLLHRYVLEKKMQLPLYEEKILKEENKHNPKYIYEYCSKVLERRWEEAEPIVFKNAEYAAKYCTKFDLPVPENIHNQIITEVAFNTAAKTSYKKKYLEKESKRRKMIQTYLRELIKNKTVTKDTTVEELLS